VHLLFTDAPKALLDKIEQVVRLVRSKGVGVYFVTQNPLDVPDKVAAQLGNRVQHALRAFTPRDQKAVRAAAETFRQNPDLDTATVITELGKGEALVSFLEGNGTPSMVERCFVRAPSARVGPVTPQERQAIIAKSPVKGKYDTAIDQESAFEKLQNRTQDANAPGGTAQGEPAPSGGILGGIGGMLGDLFGTSRARGERLSTTQRVTREVTRSVTNRVIGGVAGSIGKSVGGSMGNTIARAIVRGTLGGILRR
jgi:DNA helicase HerA-like ATPase